MKTLKFFFFFATLALFSLIANAQMPNRNINESALFRSKYFRDQVWDAQRWPSYPSVGRDWKLSGLKASIDASTSSTIDWGLYGDRYLMFTMEVDRANRSGSLTDDKSGQKYNILLNLFGRDGRFVKTVSRWGNLIGFGSEGFMYVQQGQLGTFFAADKERQGGQVTYRPEVAELKYMSDVVNTGRNNSRGYSRRMDNNDDRRNDDRRNEDSRNDDHRNDGRRNETPIYETRRNETPVYETHRNETPVYETHRNETPVYETHRNEVVVNDSRDCGNIKLTYRTFNETVNIEESIRQEFGGKCSIADWADLKAIRNIDGWISCLKLNKDQTYLLTRNGRINSVGNRQYFVHYSPTGHLPAGFLVLDKINNQLFLGSWYGVRHQVLVKDYHNL